eukprot:4613571-Alexandrium_andersonii.AAC.1
MSFNIGVNVVWSQPGVVVQPGLSALGNRVVVLGVAAGNACLRCLELRGPELQRLGYGSGPRKLGTARLAHGSAWRKLHAGPKQVAQGHMCVCTHVREPATAKRHSSMAPRRKWATLQAAAGFAALPSSPSSE